VAQRPRLRGEERFPIGRPGTLAARGRTRNCSVIDLSLSGGFLGGAGDLEVGETVRLSVDGLGPFSATVVRKAGDKVGVQFAPPAAADRDRLIVYLYTSGFCNQAQEVSPSRVWRRLLRGAVLGPA
jgi:hypothetical protein